MLRDENGYVRKVAKGAMQQKQLRKMYRDYNAKQQLEDLIKNKELKEHVKQVKARIQERGYRKRISICGIYRSQETGKPEYRRYEIFKREPWNRKEFFALCFFIKSHVPRSHAAVFMFEPQWKNGTLFFDEQDWLSQGKMRACQTWREFCRVHQNSSHIGPE